MTFKEYGDKNLPKIVLLHGMITNGFSFMKTVKKLGDKYCYIAPDFSAHGEDKSEFISAQEETQKLIGYLKQNNYNEIELLLGASMGGVIALYLITDSIINFKTIVIDSAPVYNNANLLYRGLTFMMLNKQKNAKNNLQHSVQRMSKIYGELGEGMAMSLANMNSESLRNVLWSCSHFDFPTYSDELQKRMFFEFGDKDLYSKQVKLIKNRYPYVHVNVREDYGHCEFLIHHNKEYTEMLKNYMGAQTKDVSTGGV